MSSGDSSALSGGGIGNLALSLAGSAGQFLMGLLAAHDKRVQEAKSENAAVSAALAALIHDCQVIQTGFSDGTITPAAAVQACLDVDSWYWQYINPYTQYQDANPARCVPNQLGDNPKLSAKGVRCFQSTQAGSDFTAALYMGCNIIDANLGALRAGIISLNGKPKGTSLDVVFCGWPTNKYGLTPYGGMTLKLTVPTAVQGEEVTISKSGILSVGSPPGVTDAVVAAGIITTGAVDTGQITPPTQGVPGGIGSTSALGAGTLGTGGTFLLLVAAGVVVALIAGSRS